MCHVSGHKCKSIDQLPTVQTSALIGVSIKLTVDKSVYLIYRAQPINRFTIEPPGGLHGRGNQLKAHAVELELGPLYHVHLCMNSSPRLHHIRVRLDLVKLTPKHTPLPDIF